MAWFDEHDDPDVSRELDDTSSPHSVPLPVGYDTTVRRKREEEGLPSFEGENSINRNSGYNIRLSAKSFTDTTPHGN